MNFAKQALVFSFVTCAAGAAFADAVMTPADPVVATRTRAEVQAEVVKACADGAQLAAGESRAGEMDEPLRRGLSRDQVRAQLAIHRVASIGMVEAP